METKDSELVNLIARCALKDQQALKTLYERLGPWLNAVAFRIVKTTDLSNDVLQEAFVQIWNNAASYRPEKAKALTWICSIVRYRALDRLEKERKHLDRIVDNDDVHALDNFSSDQRPDDEVNHDQMAQRIQDCLKSLNERISSCITLAYMHGYSREELAERFETPVNTVKSWLHRGSEKLKLCLEKNT